jgi:thioredoxin 1
VKNITDDTFHEVVSSVNPVLVDFWAPWCGPCKAMEPVLESVDRDNGWLDVVKINADENPVTVRNYDISSIPTLLLFKNGRIIEYKIGAAPKFKIMELIEKAR